MRTVLSKFALLAALAAAPMAKADMYHFSFTATNSPAAGNFSFDLPSSPSMYYVDPAGKYGETQVIPIDAGGKSILSVTHWFVGGFQFDSGDFSLRGATPFSGGVSNPSFLIGQYEMSEFAPSDPADRGLLVISSVTPEPASLWLMATGGVGLAAGIRRRRCA